MRIQNTAKNDEYNFNLSALSFLPNLEQVPVPVFPDPGKKNDQIRIHDTVYVIAWFSLPEWAWLRLRSHRVPQPPPPPGLWRGASASPVTPACRPGPHPSCTNGNNIHKNKDNKKPFCVPDPDPN